MAFFGVHDGEYRPKCATVNTQIESRRRQRKEHKWRNNGYRSRCRTLESVTRTCGAPSTSWATGATPQDLSMKRPGVWSKLPSQWVLDWKAQRTLPSAMR